MVALLEGIFRVEIRDRGERLGRGENQIVRKRFRHGPQVDRVVLDARSHVDRPGALIVQPLLPLVQPAASAPDRDRLLEVLPRLIGLGSGDPVLSA